MRIMQILAIVGALAILIAEAGGFGAGGGGRGGGASFGGGGGARPAAPAARPAPQQVQRPSNNGPGAQISPSGTINSRPAGGGSVNMGGGQSGGGATYSGPSVFRPGDNTYSRPGGSSVLNPGGTPATARPGTAAIGHSNDGGLGNVARTQVNQRTGGATYVTNTTLNNVGNRTRANYTNVNAFNNNNWWRNNPNAWRAASWTTARFWAGSGWGAWATFGGYPVTPVYYDYGSNVVYSGDNVYVNGAVVGSQDQYAEQAITIADTGKQAVTSGVEEWMSLGVFAMTQNGDGDSSKLFQLAVNKDGTIRGNYYDALSDTTLPVYGQVDKNSQRAAWTVGDKKNVVYETGAANLTQEQTTMLVHIGKDQTQQWTLVRLPQPAGQ